MNCWRISVLPLVRLRGSEPEVFFQRDFDRHEDLGIHAFLLERRAEKPMIGAERLVPELLT